MTMQLDSLVSRIVPIVDNHQGAGVTVDLIGRGWSRFRRRLRHQARNSDSVLHLLAQYAIAALTIAATIALVDYVLAVR
jgi:hypothetical protein